jgi:hypothetical protein
LILPQFVDASANAATNTATNAATKAIDFACKKSRKSGSIKFNLIAPMLLPRIYFKRQSTFLMRASEDL